MCHKKWKSHQNQIIYNVCNNMEDYMIVQNTNTQLFIVYSTPLLSSMCTWLSNRVGMKYSRDRGKTVDYTNMSLTGDKMSIKPQFLRDPKIWSYWVAWSVSRSRWMTLRDRSAIAIDSIALHWQAWVGLHVAWARTKFIRLACYTWLIVLMLVLPIRTIWRFTHSLVLYGLVENLFSFLV